MKHFFKIFLISIIICNVNIIEAKEELSKKEIELLNKLARSLPFVKNIDNELDKAVSIQKTYFEFNNSLKFNQAIMPYYLSKITNFQGFSSKREFIHIIPDLNYIYRDFLSSKNKVSRHRFKNKYKEAFIKVSENYSINSFNEIFYSEIPLKGVFPYDFKKNKKDMIFDNLNPNFPAIYLSCLNDEVIGIFKGEQYSDGKLSVYSNVTNTPIILKLSEELKSHFKQAKPRYGENLCLYSKYFENILEGEIFEGYSNNQSNSFIGFFTIDKNIKDKPYLVGNLSHIGYFLLDNSDFFHYPFEIIGGYTFSEKSILEVKDDFVNKLSKQKNLNTLFLNSKFSYNLGDFIIKGLEKNQIGLTKNGTRLYVKYNYEIINNEIILELAEIVRESPHNFPLKIRIFKEDNTGITTLTSYIQYRNEPHLYKKEIFELKNGFYLNWEKEVENY